jgi:hypothetical protein
MVANALFDIFLPQLPPNAWKILCLMIRQTHGWIEKRPRSTTDGMTVRAIGTMAGIKSLEAIVEALKILVKTKCLIPCSNDKWQPTAYRINSDLVIENPQQFADIVKLAKLEIANELKAREKAKTSPSVSEIVTEQPSPSVSEIVTEKNSITAKPPVNSNPSVSEIVTGQLEPLISEIVTKPVSETGLSCKKPRFFTKTSPPVSEIVTDSVSEIVTVPVSETETPLLNMKEKDKETEEKDLSGRCSATHGFDDGTFEIKKFKQDYVPSLNRLQIVEQRRCLEWSRQRFNVERNDPKDPAAVAWLIASGCDFFLAIEIFESLLANPKWDIVNWSSVKAVFPTYAAKKREQIPQNKAEARRKESDDLIDLMVQEVAENQKKKGIKL